MINIKTYITAIILVISLNACGELKPVSDKEVEPLTTGPFSVGTTNMEVADEFLSIGDDEMHNLLIGSRDESGEHKYFASVLKYPNSVFLSQVAIPDNAEAYPELHGKTYPIVSYIAYPIEDKSTKNTYAFPYHNAQYGKFEDMLSEGESPQISNALDKFPLVILSHGMSAHAIYDVGHAQKIASHGYIVLVITYGDHRIESDKEFSFLRPLITKTVLDDLLMDKNVGPRIDTDNIGISGFSFGGFTSLALAGGQFLASPDSTVDSRITAAFVGAPWVGTKSVSGGSYPFGDKNQTLSNISIPVMTLYGSKDTVTTAASILPATKLFSGPTYVVKLVDQGHGLEEGSWFDRDSWELLFFAAYLQNNQDAHKTLKTAGSMKGGNKDYQLKDYQRNLQ